MGSPGTGVGAYRVGQLKTWEKGALAVCEPSEEAA